MLDSLFRPQKVAVIGASTKELSIGNRVIKNLIDFGFKGEIYPINPKADEVRGIKAYKSILDCPENIDVVHMVIPAKFVPQAVEDCGHKGVKNIIINSGGFSETGPEGEAIENEFLARAKKYGIRMFGPNCQGIINSDPDIRAYCNFTFTKPDPGFISIVALSGGVAEVIHQGFSAMGVGTRIYASNGNACDVTIPEIIRYLGDDDGTRVIVTYVVGLRDPANFLEVAQEVAAKNPVLAMKAGRTIEGAKAAASHTGGLAKEDIATDLIFKKAGVLTFMDEGELIQAAAAFASQPVPKGNRVGIITNTGGPAVIATDVLVGAGLEIPPLSAKSETFLKEKLYAEASVKNPVDVLATATAEHYRACLDAMMEDGQFDCVFVNFVTPFFVDNESIAREIVAVSNQQKKPIVCNLMTDKSALVRTVDGGRTWLEIQPVMNFSSAPAPKPRNTFFARLPPTSLATRTSAQAVPSGYGRFPCSFSIRKRRSGTMNSTPMSPPQSASSVIWRRRGSRCHMNSAGSVKITPLATELEADPTVWDMFASSRVPRTPTRRSRRNAATVMTATGMDVEIVKPAWRPR